MSLGVGQAMVNAAHGAMLGQAIGDARDLADEANRRGHDWMKKAKELEAEVDRLKQSLRQAKANSDAKDRVIAEIAETEAMLSRLADSEAKTVMATFERAKQYKGRLNQVEKALRHSSANAEALKIILAPYKALVARLKLEGDLPADMQAQADEVWRKYITGENFTNDPDVQAILDANPLPAPPPRSLK